MQSIVPSGVAMLNLFAQGAHISALAVFFLFGIYYAISTLLVVCLLLFSSSIRMRNSVILSIISNALSLTVSLGVIVFLFSTLTLHNTLIFLISNFVFQCSFLIFAYGVPIQSFLLPLIIGNSLAYWLVFPNVVRLLEL